MTRNSSRRVALGNSAFGLLGLLLLVTHAGCIGIASQLLWMGRGEKVPAEFAGLQGKKVAVVCVSSSSTYGQDATARMLSSAVSSILKREVKDIDVIPQADLEDWIDTNSWNQIDYREIGQGVKAKVLIAIDLEYLRLHEGQTLFKGNARIGTKVYDMEKEGRLVWERKIPDFAYPKNGGYPTTDKSEQSFRAEFVAKLARQIANPFHAREFKDDFGDDATIIGM